MSRTATLPRVTDAQVRVLGLAEAGLIVATWLEGTEYPGRGLKPGFPISGGGVRGTQLHSLWLDGLIRLDRHAFTFVTAGTRVGRVRLTPLGERTYHANGGGYLDAA